MAIPYSKPNVLPFSALFVIFFALLLNNVNSQSYSPSVRPHLPPSFPPVLRPVPVVQPRFPPLLFPPIRPRFPPSVPLVPEPISLPSLKTETTAFGFSFFEPDARNLAFLGDASVSSGVIQLTKKDYSGKPLPYSVGQVGMHAPIHLWDKSTGSLADFSTTFSFVVNPNGPTLNGDGFAFFMIPLDSGFPIKNSTGGYLGLFRPDTALDPSKNKILAIEFDTFGNDWDMIRSPHVGIDINSIRSVESVSWSSSSEPSGAIVHASINYNSESKRLSVAFGYGGSSTVFSYVVDLRTVVPEWVHVGFSGATGALVETHEILSWSFESALAWNLD